MTHTNNAELEAIRLEYRASLADLTFNSKPIITNLTIIAQENPSAASAIVQAIEDQIRNAQPKQKLPVLYLMDSICKNVGGAYLTHFGRNVVRTFASAYEAVDADDKQRFLKVLNTWKNHPNGPIFPLHSLTAVETAIRKSGPQPRRKSSVGQIYVNPNFVARVRSTSPQSPVAKTNALSGPSQQNGAQGRGTGRSGQRTPYDRPPSGRGRQNTSIQRRTDGRRDNRQQASSRGSSSQALHTSLVSSAIVPQAVISPLAPLITPSSTIGVDIASLQQQIRTLLTQKEALAILNPMDTSLAGHIQVLGQLLQAVQNTALDMNSLQQIAQMLQQYAVASAAPVPAPQPAVVPDSLPPILSTILPSQTLAMGGAQMSYGVQAPLPAPTPFSAPAAGFMTSVTLNPMLPTGIQGLLANPNALDGLLGTLKASPLTGGIPFPSGPPIAGQDASIGTFGQDGPRVRSIRDLPRVRLANEDINKVYPGAVSLLYEALDLRCRQCGTRYRRDQTGRAKMDAHLDWHFRQNRRAKEKAKKAISRDWFVTEDDWIKETEVDIRDKRVPTLFFEQEKAAEKPQVEVSNIPAEGETNPHCAVCHESLEKIYDEDAEDWMLRAAVRIDGKLYHQACYQDSPEAKSPTESKDSDSPGGTDAVEQASLGKRKREEDDEFKQYKDIKVELKVEVSEPKISSVRPATTSVISEVVSQSIQPALTTVSALGPFLDGTSIPIPSIMAPMGVPTSIQMGGYGTAGMLIGQGGPQG